METLTQPELLTFPIDVKSVLAHMRQDMKDDWFSDSLKYEDLYTDKISLIETIRKNLEIGHGQYNASQRHIYDVPKASYGLRYSLEIDFYDRFLYQAICSYLLPYFDRLISNRVFSHRYNKHRKKEKDLFKNRIELWQTFEGVTHLGIHDGKTLLATDLINYFEYISISSINSSFMSLLPNVKATGSEKVKIRSALFTLNRLLEKWCFNELHGLPQNRDASSFIANVVLCSVDKSMLLNGYDYYRYVDDIRIVCSDVHGARKALSVLIKELRKLGMNINSKKTNILNSNSTESDLIATFPGYDDRTIAIDNMWRSKNKKVITRSIPLLHEMLSELISQNQTQSRQFRFCINRFKSLISTNIFETNSIVADDISSCLIRHLEDQPVSTDQFCKLLSGLKLKKEHFDAIESFILDKSKAIYHWQNYHLWLLLSSLSYKSDRLISEAKHRITHSLYDADIPACFIYLSSVGHAYEVEQFIPMFQSNWPYQHQRFFLIALQNSDKSVLKHLVAKLPFTLQGTIKRIKSNAKLKGTFISSSEDTSFEEIYDELNPYD